MTTRDTGGLPGNHGQFGAGDASEAFRPLADHAAPPQAAPPDDGAIADVARRHGVGVEAVRVLLEALRHGGFRQAQFSHAELGGMGQWSSGGMTQVGDMFNTGLRDKVAALCAELSRSAASMPAPAPPRESEAARDWWPSALGRPSATGAQNGMQYACFPDARRVAIEQAGAVTVYDSGEHRINGVSQSQSGSGAQGMRDLVFSSQSGEVRASDLPVVPG